MGIHATIYRANHDQEAGKPLSPERVASGESVTIPFTINNGVVTSNPDAFLFWADQVPSTGIEIALTWFGVSNGDAVNLPNPLRFDWFLYASGSCVVDDEPVWEGSSWLDLTKGKASVRNGRLVQVSGLTAQAWFLRLVMQDPGIPITLKGSLEYSTFEQPAIGGPISSAGCFVG